MRSRALPLVLLVIVCAGCLGTLGDSVTDGTEDTAEVPPAPDRPETLTNESVAAYANASETHHVSREYAERATELHVTCRPTPVAVTQDAGYAYVTCRGGFRSESVDGEIRSVSVYRVTGNETVRVDDSRLVPFDGPTEEADPGDYRRLRVFDLADDSVTLSVRLSDDATRRDGPATHEYRLDPRTGVWSELGSKLVTEQVRVTATLADGERLTTDWTSDGRLSSDDLAGVVVVTPDGDLLWTTASW